MDNPFKSPTVLSFCPGLLGLERGLKRVIGEINIAAYVEIEAFIIANILAGMESGVLAPTPIWTDAETFDARPFRGRIHGIIGGYPCPGESLSGLREGHLYKGFIWPSIRKAIDAARPLWCFFENVDDHLTGTYPIVQRSLRNMGYRVEAGVYSAEEVGASHERQRLFILALADSYCYGARAGLQRVLDKSGEIEKAEQRKEWESLQRERRGYELRSSRAEMAKLDNADSTRRENIGLLCEHGSQSNGRVNERSFDFWTAPQGIDQYEWEAPRTIKSGLGVTIDGYNFRYDILHAIGNMVVSQSAAYAIKDLIKKHLKNIG